jgi:ABC-type glycerol-3-phosphate transport system substrate-binding protein
MSNPPKQQQRAGIGLRSKDFEVFDKATGNWFALPEKEAFEFYDKLNKEGI